MTKPYLSLVTQPDVRDLPFSVLVVRLILWYPLAFGAILPHDPKSALWRLQSGLGVQTSFCGEVYERLTASYLLPSSEITKWWVQKNDISLGELHQRLWHEANMRDTPFYRRSYLR